MNCFIVFFCLPYLLLCLPRLRLIGRLSHRGLSRKYDKFVFSHYSKFTYGSDQLLTVVQTVGNSLGPGKTKTHRGGNITEASKFLRVLTRFATRARHHRTQCCHHHVPIFVLPGRAFNSRHTCVPYHVLQPAQGCICLPACTSVWLGAGDELLYAQLFKMMPGQRPLCLNALGSSEGPAES